MNSLLSSQVSELHSGQTVVLWNLKELHVKTQISTFVT